MSVIDKITEIASMRRNCSHKKFITKITGVSFAQPDERSNTKFSFHHTMIFAKNPE